MTPSYHHFYVCSFLSICNYHTSNCVIIFVFIVHVIVLFYSLLNLFGYWTINIYYYYYLYSEFETSILSLNEENPIIFPRLSDEESKSRKKDEGKGILPEMTISSNVFTAYNQTTTSGKVLFKIF